FIPSATAPELTRTTSLPSARRRAICVAQRAIAASSRPRPSLVTSVEPTLTTSRCASRTAPACGSAGTSARPGAFCGVARAAGVAARGPCRGRFARATPLPVFAPASAMNAPARLVAVRIAASGESHVWLDTLLRPHGLEPLGDRQAQRLAALARERRDREHPLDRKRMAAAPAIPGDERIDAPAPLGGIDHVDLVQHQPAGL